MEIASVWVASAETDCVRDVALFHSPEGAKKWCDEMIAKYHYLDILPEWKINTHGEGSIRWQPAQSFSYYLQDVKP